MDIGDIRRDYMGAPFDFDNLDSNPYKQFERWFQEATAAQIEDVNAMSLATADASGVVGLRTVLLKMFDEKGFVFFTNYESDKAKHIEENPNVAMCLLWLPLNRQIIIQGRAEKVSQFESLRYFTSRPRGSQLGAWCSAQSSVITSRSLLEGKLNEIKNKFRDGEIPLPSFWGGYRIVPWRMQFWQGRKDRLHDRFHYLKQSDGSWQIERLQP